MIHANGKTGSLGLGGGLSPIPLRIGKQVRQTEETIRELCAPGPGPAMYAAPVNRIGDSTYVNHSLRASRPVVPVEDRYSHLAGQKSKVFDGPGVGKYDTGTVTSSFLLKRPSSAVIPSGKRPGNSVFPAQCKKDGVLYKDTPNSVGPAAIGREDYLGQARSKSAPRTRFTVENRYKHLASPGHQSPSPGPVYGGYGMKESKYKNGTRAVIPVSPRITTLWCYAPVRGAERRHFQPRS